MPSCMIFYYKKEVFFVNFYEEKLKELQMLMKTKEYQEALRLINLELSMPYIPADFEAKLLKIKAKIPFDQLGNETHNLTPKEIFTLINSRELALMEKIGLMQALQSVNLRSYLDESNEILQSHLPNELKMILCYFLCEQQIDYDFTYQKNKETFSFNPEKFDLDTQEMVPMKVIEKLDSFLNSLSPQLLEMAKQIMVNVYAKAFPFNQKFDFTLLAKAIIKVVYQLNGLTDELPYNYSDGEQEIIERYLEWMRELDAI